MTQRNTGSKMVIFKLSTFRAIQVEKVAENELSVRKTPIPLISWNLDIGYLVYIPPFLEGDIERYSRPAIHIGDLRVTIKHTFATRIGTRMPLILPILVLFILKGEVV